MSTATPQKIHKTIHQYRHGGCPGLATNPLPCEQLNHQQLSHPLSLLQSPWIHPPSLVAPDPVPCLVNALPRLQAAVPPLNSAVQPAVEPGWYINTSLSQPSEAMALLAVKALKRTCRVIHVSLD
jgi:hypothetical protein